MQPHPFAGARPPTYGWSIPPPSLINALSGFQTEWRRVNKHVRAQMRIRIYSKHWRINTKGAHATRRLNV